MIITKIARES